jgi:hypothetical protein
MLVLKLIFEFFSSIESLFYYERLEQIAARALMTIKILLIL